MHEEFRPGDPLYDDVQQDLARTRKEELALAQRIVRAWEDREDLTELRDLLGVSTKRRGRRRTWLAFARDMMLAQFAGLQKLGGAVDPIGKTATDFPDKDMFGLSDPIEQRMIERAIAKFRQHDQWIESIDPEGHAQQTITYRTFDNK